jgi:outer membrane protein assembly factor BamB
MKFTLTQRKRTASFGIAGSMLAIAPLWLMLAAANTSAQAQTTESSADWTEFHRDNMQRWNPYETVLGVGNVGGLQLKWQSIPISYIQQGNTIESSPAVVNGVVYIGNLDGSLYALNASTGATLWSTTKSGGGSSSPAVANGVVYYGFGAGMFALNASTGASLWGYEVDDYAFSSSPAVANGIVYVGSEDNNVYALGASTGIKLWSYATGNEVLSSPAVANGVVYVGSDDNNVYALNASTGAKLWSYTTGGGVFSSPAVANGVVYVGSEDNNAYALNASTGAKLWSYATGNKVLSSPAVANGVVYVASDDGNTYALNASTGAKLRSYTTGNAISNSSPAVVDGVVYQNAADASGQMNVYAFSLGSASADLFLRIIPTTTTVHQGDLLTYAFPVWNLGPDIADQEVLNTQVPAGTVFDYIRISGTPGLGTCSYTPYLGAGPIPIVCHQNGSMALNTTWTVRLTVKVTAPAGTVITENAATSEDTFDPNLANNMATVSLTVVP